jgi:hypothetical protein
LLAIDEPLDQGDLVRREVGVGCEDGRHQIARRFALAGLGQQEGRHLARPQRHLARGQAGKVAGNRQRQRQIVEPVPRQIGGMGEPAPVAGRVAYGGLPGDYAQGQAQLGTPRGVSWVSPRCGGGDRLCDGDGIIEGNGRTNETLMFWQHLGLADLISGIEIAAAVDDSIGAGLPRAAIGGGLAVQHQVVGGRASHWLRLGTGAELTIGVATGAHASSIDRKIDDGRPGTGSVRMTSAACMARGEYNPTGDRCLMYYELNRQPE